MSVSKTLKIFNKKGSVLAFTNYGASLKSWNFELNENNKVDVVLGYGDEINYKSNPLYLGCIAGRYANRIAKGKFRLGGMQISLAKNDNGNHLHGGHKGFSSIHWNVVDHKKKYINIIFRKQRSR